MVVLLQRSALSWFLCRRQPWFEIPKFYTKTLRLKKGCVLETDYANFLAPGLDGSYRKNGYLMGEPTESGLGSVVSPCAALEDLAGIPSPAASEEDRRPPETSSRCVPLSKLFQRRRIVRVPPHRRPDDAPRSLAEFENPVLAASKIHAAIHPVLSSMKVKRSSTCAIWSHEHAHLANKFLLEQFSRVSVDCYEMNEQSAVLNVYIEFLAALEDGPGRSTETSAEQSQRNRLSGGDGGTEEEDESERCPSRGSSRATGSGVAGGSSRSKPGLGSPKASSSGRYKDRYRDKARRKAKWDRRDGRKSSSRVDSTASSPARNGLLFFDAEDVHLGQPVSKERHHGLHKEETFITSPMWHYASTSSTNRSSSAR
ncbi:unnamed protein product [Notodromas monacha]|uniref:Uncharacterized protein n=1 Tax=Notodromas monacha TaxID=399045 RepID=A0A7R9BTR6_9CRUS|nr:unnamed protein product [Notodromas monacha]CAG0921267.1 unnamed protein product [Notodromas monacha]